jgi:hypothetical protein
MTDNKPFPQHPQQHDVNDSNGSIKCPSGRPSVEETPQLQKEYVEIYKARIIEGISEEEIAITRGISRGKVKNAVQWCRIANTGYSTAEEIIDAVNRLDYRFKALVNEQNRLQGWLNTEYATVNALPAGSMPEFIQLKRIDLLSRLFLLHEDRIQVILKEKHSMKRLLGNFMPNDMHSLNPQIQWICEFTEEIKKSGMTDEERHTIAEIFRKSAERQGNSEQSLPKTSIPCSNDFKGQENLVS